MCLSDCVGRYESVVSSSLNHYQTHSISYLRATRTILNSLAVKLCDITAVSICK